MDTAADCGETAFGPWNPGITSHIPRDIRHLATLYRPENSFTDVARAEELHDLTGLDCSELVAFRLERLALHELLIRVTADFSVPDGEKIEDLGINFRRIVGILLPRQEQPVVMNTKGASASGKSTLRPRQKKLAGDIGVRWGDFALISPDIWRKQLLDYATLGPACKYDGAFTGEELQIIDQKLDRYMARKAERGEMTHLLIDRFRFDSFAPDSDEAGSNLLTRFGHSVYLFFMITPPESLVERAWARGLDVGRYKAVDDTLGHGVEAYSGMPQLFFTWVRRTDKRVHFEFLDNSVRQGERPRTVAFGSNDVLNVLDVKCLLDVERYRRVNVDATAPSPIRRRALVFWLPCRPRSTARRPRPTGRATWWNGATDSTSTL